MTPEEDVTHFLATGDYYDPAFRNWPGRSVLDACQRGDRAMREALVAAVAERARTVQVPEVHVDDPTGQVAPRLRAMVEGLLPRATHDAGFNHLLGSVTFVLPSTIEVALTSNRLSTAWDIANLYLGWLGAELLGPEARAALGLACGHQCYVTAAYFTDSGPFEDYVVHECAHVLQDTKRRYVGLPETRAKEWVLDLDYRKRETFAYCCEAFSRIAVPRRKAAERRALVEEHAQGPPPPDDSVDHAEYIDILREAAAARNGWKRIAARCAPPKAPRRSGAEAGAREGDLSANW